MIANPLFLHYHIQQSHLSQHGARLQPPVCGIVQPPGVGQGPVSQPHPILVLWEEIHLVQDRWMFSNEALAWVERPTVATWASPDFSCI